MAPRRLPARVASADEFVANVANAQQRALPSSQSADDAEFPDFFPSVPFRSVGALTERLHAEIPDFVIDTGLPLAARPHSSNRSRSRRCEICFHPQSAPLRPCPRCNATACHHCLRSWLRVRIEDGDVNHLSCFLCHELIPDSEVRSIVGELDFKRCLFFRSKIEHGSDSTAAWCPKVGCWKLLQCNGRKLNMHAPNITCPDCHTQVCPQCFSEGHGDEKCPVPTVAVREKTLSSIWEKFHTKKCPICRVKIERAGGCSLMRCANCRTKFCWKCKGLINSEDEFTRRNRRAFSHKCYCTKVDNVFMWISVTGGVVIILPVAIVGLVLVGPPALITYAVLPKEKKRVVRAQLAEAITF